MYRKLIVKKFDELIELMKIEINLMVTALDKNITMYKISALEKNNNYMKKMKEIKSANDLRGIAGFGKGTLARIDEIIKTGTLKEIINIKQKIKKMYSYKILVDKLCNVIGIGSITAINLIGKYNIKSLSQFKKDVKSGKILVNDKIKLGLIYEGKYEKEIKRKYITEIYDKIKNIINIDSIICGSYRRGNEKSHDIDLLLCDKKLLTMDDVKNSTKLKSVIQKLKENGIITNDITSENVKTKYMGFVKYKNKLYRIDIRLIPKESYYSAILYFTGSHEHNIKMRNRARKMAYKLNEYGIYNVMGKRVNVNSEKDIFNILKMPYLEPYERII